MNGHQRMALWVRQSLNLCLVLFNQTPSLDTKRFSYQNLLFGITITIFLDIEKCIFTALET